MAHDDTKDLSRRARLAVAWRELTLRQAALTMHRVVGLAVAIFLVVAGLTGSMLAFYDDLDAAVARDLKRVTPPAASAPALGPTEIARAVTSRVEGAEVTSMNLHVEPGRSVRLWAKIPSGEGDGKKVFREFFVDPWRGRVLGSRAWGDLSEGRVNVMPFVYRLHYSLALDTTGGALMGIVALLWTFDCFVGMYLTFPARRRRRDDEDASRVQAARSWLGRWRHSWLVRTGKLFSTIFTWHRASGLWAWALLFVLAWSAVGFNLKDVYEPVMGTFLEYSQVRRTLPKLDAPRPEPKLGWNEALAKGEAHMQAQAKARDVEVFEAYSLGYSAKNGLYSFRARTSRDVSDHEGRTMVWLDGDTGDFVAFDAPTGEHSGDTVNAWLFGMHMASVAPLGFAYRIIICIMGLVIAVLSASGVYIWWTKRSRRKRP